MSCKNCSEPLSLEDKYCNECGAKVINKRLTLKYLFTEFYESFFSIDSSRPVRTFIDLFKKPEDVIDSYINGTRKKYIHAFGYFTIAVTLYSLFYFVFLKFFPEILDSAFSFQDNKGAEVELARTFQRTIFDYQSFIFFASIPILALISWIVFLNKKKYNYAEHLIINLYGYSQASIASLILLLLTVWNQSLFALANIAVLFIQIIYFAYLLKKLFKLSATQLLIKTLYFLLLFIPLYIIVGIIAVSIMMLTGSFDELIEAEKARQAVSYIASYAIN